MSWNYRMTRRRVPPDGEHLYEVREVYYDDRGEVISWSANPISPAGDSWQELYDDIARMGRVSNHPVLDLDTREDIPLVRRRRG